MTPKHESTKTCRLIEFQLGPSIVGPRIGGSPPHGIVPRWRTPFTCYIGTFTIDVESREYSLFFGGNKRSIGDPLSLIDAANTIMLPGPIVHVVIHGPSTRSATDCIGSPVQPHAVFVGAEVADIGVTDGSTYVRAEAKLGGDAAIMHPGFLGREYAATIAAGFEHCLQLPTLPMMFPWDPGVLNVLARPPFLNDDFRFIVQS